MALWIRALEGLERWLSGSARSCKEALAALPQDTGEDGEETVSRVQNKGKNVNKKIKIKKGQFTNTCHSSSRGCDNLLGTPKGTRH